MHVQYVGCFPFKFLQLLDLDIAKRARALTFCERSWSCLQKLEANALTCHKLAGFLKDLGFPSMPWARHIFVGLSEGQLQGPNLFVGAGGFGRLCPIFHVHLVR